MSFVTCIFLISILLLWEVKKWLGGRKIHKNMWGNCASDFNVPKAELIKWFPSSCPSKCDLGNSLKGRGVTWQLGRNADSLAPPTLLNQQVHFDRWTLLQCLVDFPRWHDAAGPGGNSQYLSLVVEHLLTHWALWLGSSPAWAHLILRIT